MNFNNFNLDNLKKIIEIMFDVARSAYRSFEMKKKIVRIMVDASYSNVYGLSPNFFGLIVTSLTESSMLNLCLVYDNHKDAFGIKNILKLTRHLVDTGTSISDLTREDISNDLKKTSELESLGVLKELRNKKFGHASYQAILHEEYMPKPASMKFDEIEQLINYSLKILQKYHKKINGNFKAIEIIGEDDYIDLIEMAKTGLAHIEIQDQEFLKKLEELKEKSFE